MADNATNMDKMSEYLDKKVVAYLSVNRTCCFNHVLSLTGKALLKQFDIMKKNSDSEDGEDLDQVLSPEKEELLELAEGIEEEELTMAPDTGTKNDEEDTIADKDLQELEEWLDKVSSEMTKEEWLALAANIHPVSQVLIKVWKSEDALTLLTGSTAS